MGKGYLSYTMALILQALDNGYRYGFDVMTKWEREGIAQQEQRPARKYYDVTREGRAALSEARQRFRLLEQLTPQLAGKPARAKG
jgi:PadR family transcriptional regulator PadR